MRPELIVKGQNWKSRLYILIYAIALLLMIKLLIGIVGLNEKSLDEGGVDKTEIRKAR
jgi:hypothetical protein